MSEQLEEERREFTVVNLVAQDYDQQEEAMRNDQHLDPSMAEEHTTEKDLLMPTLAELCLRVLQQDREDLVE